MWFSKRYDGSQIKVNHQACVCVRVCEDSRVLQHPWLYNRTWSATMPPYAYTELCPVAEFKRSTRIIRRRRN